MNLVRSIITFFLLALLVVSIAGWNWAGGQPASNAVGARIVLTLGGLAALGCIVLLWRAKPGESNEVSMP